MKKMKVPELGNNVAEVELIHKTKVKYSELPRVVDFSVLFHRCSVSDLLQKLDIPGILNPHQKPALSVNDIENNPIEILSVHQISSIRRLEKLAGHPHIHTNYRPVKNNYYEKH